MDEPVEISYAALVAQEGELVQGAIGDGVDAQGRRFWIRRYTARRTGRIYDCVFVSGLDSEPRCAAFVPAPAAPR